MVRLADLSAAEREHLLSKAAHQRGHAEGRGPTAGRAGVALVTTAGLHRVGDDPFAHGRQGPPQMIGPTAGELARPLLADHVDAVCLVPI